MSKKAFLYARTSTEDSAKDSMSIESQLEECQAYAEENGYKVIRSFTDDGISGATAVFERRGLKAAKEAAKEADVLIVREFDRLSRGDKGPALRGYIEWDLEQVGLDVEYVKKDETGDPGLDYLIGNLKDAYSVMERYKIRERTMRGSQKHVQNGSVIVSRPAYGYRKTGDKETGRGLEKTPDSSSGSKRDFRAIRKRRCFYVRTSPRPNQAESPYCPRWKMEKSYDKNYSR